MPDRLPEAPAVHLAEAMRKLLEHRLFRSATLSELVLDGDFFRRPCRPEDLAIIDFGAKLGAGRMTSLAAMMSHRVLLTINETGYVRPPRCSSEARLSDWAEFYSASLRSDGLLVKPLLEDFCFSFLQSLSLASHTDEIIESFNQMVASAEQYWDNLFNDYELEDDQRLALRTTLISETWSQRIAAHCPEFAPAGPASSICSQKSNSCSSL